MQIFSRRERSRMTVIDHEIGEHENCGQCGLFLKNLHNPKMSYGGEGKRNVLLLGEAPGELEDIKNDQFIGKVGIWFEPHLRERGIKLHKDLYKYNSTNCWPWKRTRNMGQEGRAPTKEEITLCRPNVEKVIRELQPNLIIAAGGCAVTSLYGDLFSKIKMSKWRGLCIPDRKRNCWVVPIFHPSFPMRNTKDLNLQSQFGHDLDFAISCIDKPLFEFDEPTEKVKIITDYQQVISLLTKYVDNPPENLYFDYETSGLKPFAPGHFIASISFAVDEDEAYSFPFQYSGAFTEKEIRKIKRLWRRILQAEKSKKEAHNVKFEDVWSRRIMGVAPANWYWDGMLSAHIIDNRKGFTGLKMQGFVYFGVTWGDEITAYIRKTKGGRKGGNSFNRINEAPLRDLLLYGGMDSLIGIRLSNVHKKLIRKKPGLRNALDFLLEGSLEFARMEITGICANEEYYNRKSNSLLKHIERLDKKLNEGPEAVAFEKKMKRKLNINSNVDLGDLLKKVLKVKTTVTPGNRPKVDKDVLADVNIPFTKRLLKKKKLSKVRGTYLAQFKREVYNGKIHPSFGLNIPISYRSNSSNPNFQNIPVRDEESKLICRGGIIPSLGNMLLDWDYGVLEVCTSCCYHYDPTMIKYVTNPASDMHRDNACDLFFLKPTEVTKIIRFYIKNCWTFPQFYGDWYESCAYALIKNCFHLKLDSGITIINHLRSKGISSIEDFIEHCRIVEDKMWNVRFRVYTEWKKKIQKEYQKNGFISTHLGFEFRGLMNAKTISNYPIQGTAFHILLRTLLEVNKIARRDKWKTKSIFQTHDSGTNDLFPKELNLVCKTINYVGTELIREIFPWIIVPLTIEFELGKIDQPWNTIEEIVPIEDNCDICGSEWIYKSNVECAVCGNQLVPF